jgi:AraC-like DNA-binding protein
MMNKPLNPPRNKTTVAMGFVTGMLAGMLRRNMDCTTVLAAAEVDLADPASRIPIERYAALYNAINHQLDDEGFGLFSQTLPCGSFEFLCRATISAPTLAIALERASRYLRIVLPDLAVDIEKTAKTAAIHLRETRPLAGAINDPGRVFAFEWLLRLLHGLACWLVGRGIALDQVSFPYARPAHADDYSLIYSEHFAFQPGVENGPANTLTAQFNANLLDLPIRRDEAALSTFLAGAPGKLTTLYRRDREMVSRVRDLLRKALPELPSQDAAAAHLFLSSRTLHRRLEEEGSSFRAIKDALRRDMALARLAKSRAPIAQVASDLGYADPSAFYRACVEWTGMAPVEYRRQCDRDGNSIKLAGHFGE